MSKPNRNPHEKKHAAYVPKKPPLIRKKPKGPIRPNPPKQTDGPSGPKKK